MLQKKSSKTHFLIKTILVFFLIVILFFAIYIFFSYFKIKKIEVISKNNQYKVYGTEILKNKNTILLNTNYIKKILIERNSQIKKISIEKKLPDTLLINIDFFDFFVQLKTNNGYFLLTNNGKIIEKKKTEFSLKYPKINYYQKFDFLSYKPGDFIDYKDLIYAITFADRIIKNGMKVDSIDITSPNMIRLLMNDSVVYFTTEKDIELQKNQLVKIIGQFKIEGKNFSSLDLRFEKPIIKLK